MKILSITPAFAPQLGGIEMVVQELALRLQARGHQVDVAHVNPLHAQPSVDTVAGLTVHRVPLRGHRLAGWASGLGELARGYDLLHVHDPQLMAITANVRMQCAKVPAVLSTHGGFHHTQQMALFKALFEKLALRSMLSHYRLILASSVSDEAWFQRHSDRVVLCSNGVSTDKFGVVPVELDRPLHKWVYWGRLSRNKRVDKLIDAVAQARHLGHPVELLVCGRDFDGIADQLHQQAARLNLGDVVKFEPFLPDDALLQTLRQYGVYTTASEHEGFGLSIVEAMAAGMQVMCRDMSPLNTFVQSGVTGRFLAFDEGAADASALHALLQQGSVERAQGRAQARQTADQYNWDAAAERFEACFHQALA